MGEILYIGLLAAAYLLLKVLSRERLTSIVMTLLGKSGLEKVGRTALAGQPDRITLQARPAPTAQSPASGSIRSLERRGFTSAGSYSIAEMPGVTVHFLVKEPESSVGVVYEHPKAGIWCDLYSRYRDGGSFSVTSAPAGGSLERKPGHASVRAPGQPAAMLHVRLITERPAGELQPIGADAVAQHFAQAYAEETAWRKGHGITAAEVRGAALERVG